MNKGKGLEKTKITVALLCYNNVRLKSIVELIGERLWFMLSGNIFLKWIKSIYFVYIGQTIKQTAGWVIAFIDITFLKYFPSSLVSRLYILVIQQC